MQITFGISMFIAAILSVLSGLGIGGGSILILWLTIVKDYDVLTARIINLMFFIPAAVIASAFHIRKKDLEIRTLIPAMVSGCVCAVLLSIYTQSASSDLLKKAFGVVLIITGLREITYRARKAK